MISYLEGKVVQATEKYAVIMAGGVGYKVSLPAGTAVKLSQANGTVKVHTHLHIREERMELYGFLTPQELELFELLITVSGVGPRVALAIISTDKPNVIAGAIAAEDKMFFIKISGIGRRIAEKVIVDLKDKIGMLSFGMQKSDTALDADAIDALMALGWRMHDAREALKRVPKEIKKTELRVTEAMKLLGK